MMLEMALTEAKRQTSRSDPANWPQHQAHVPIQPKIKEIKPLWVWWKKNSRTDSAINDFEYSSVPMDGCISSARFSVGS